MLREFEAAEPRPEELADVQWIQSELARRRAATSPTPEPAQPRAVVAPASRGGLAAGLSDWLAALFEPRRRFALSMACGALLVIFVVGISLRHNSEEPLTGSNPVFRSSDIVAIAPAGDLTAPPTEFHWEAVPAAAAYAIELTGVDGAVLWSAQSTVASVAVPAAIRAQFVPGRAFRWSVTARNTAGQKIASSNLQSFDISATAH